MAISPTSARVLPFRTAVDTLQREVRTLADSLGDVLGRIHRHKLAARPALESAISSAAPVHRAVIAMRGAADWPGHLSVDAALARRGMLHAIDGIDALTFDARLNPAKGVGDAIHELRRADLLLEGVLDPTRAAQLLVTRW